MRAAVRSRSEDAALVAISIAGLAVFVLPLRFGSASAQAPGLFAALVAVSAIAVVAIALQTRRLSGRLIAILAALVAVDASLRLVLVIGLLGFSPIFFLIIAAGYVMGPGFGFAMGSMTLLLSAFVTSGFGPWLPYQMLASGWVGMGAGYLGILMSHRAGRASTVLLAAYGLGAGFAYGLLLDLWEWPALLGAGSSWIAWAPGLPVSSLLQRFLAFYLATSVIYDTFRAAGNFLLVLLLGPPVISALRRFKHRFLVEWVPTAKLRDDVRSPA